MGRSPSWEMSWRYCALDKYYYKTPDIEDKNANDIVDIWQRIYHNQLASHGMGTAACLALSGLDLALWDIRGKAIGLPLYKLLGGNKKEVPSYAGGIALGYQEPDQLVEEAKPLIDSGFKALKSSDLVKI